MLHPPLVLPALLLLQSAAEASARHAREAAATRALADSEARCEALREQLMEAREALDCAQAQADLRDTLAQQVGGEGEQLEKPDNQ
jgi:hypothetical protein